MTEAKTLTLTEFLLARIAEDEGYARAEERRFTASYGPAAILHEPRSPVLFTRLLAECEAKRRIIAVCVGDDPDQGEMDPRFADERVPALVLRALALPYADHPDYRDEWRP